MATNPSPPALQPPPTRAPRLCGICKRQGHDRRNCPSRLPSIATEVVENPAGNQNAVDARVIPPFVAQPAAQIPHRINWEECMYVLFDLETTGGSRANDDIIEIAALVVGPDAVMIEDGTYHAFGRMKFKVRIISKAARYGIKLYVVTDATTSYVLKVLVYTGKYTYQESTSESLKKTVQVVQQLVEPFRGSFRTVYVDRFYTSIDLIKELHEMQLFVTGTVLSNRIPKNVTIAKSSKQFKEMQRGDVVKHVFHYKDKSGQVQKAGLVLWKDRNIVYSMTNDTTTTTMDVCTRRGQGGLVEIQRPTVISRYNMYMGGVDVADMRRLHCSSTIMGQNRWWLKLFFYLLDVGTSNALAIYNEAMKDKQKPLNIVEFKTRLVESLVGQKFKDMAREHFEQEVEHVMVKLPNNNRQRCSYCALTGTTHSRSRFMCQGCGVPYCSIGSGKTTKDCFALAHDNEQIRELCVKKYACQQKHTTKKRRPKRRREA